MQKTFTVYQNTIESRTIREPGAYRYNPQGKVLWLQKLCFKILSKLSCENTNQEPKYRRMEVNPTDVVASLSAQKRNILRSMNVGNEGCEVFIGPERFAQMCTDNNNFMTFHATIEETGQIMNMAITIVPWMSGELVVPRVRRRQVGVQ